MWWEVSRGDFSLCLSHLPWQNKNASKTNESPPCVYIKVSRVLYLYAGVKIKKTLRNQTVTETQEAVFTLELTHPDVKGSQWIKNGVELQNSEKYEIVSSGVVQTLKVKDCNIQDESVYSFKLGKLSANARLNVESKCQILSA